LRELNGFTRKRIACQRVEPADAIGQWSKAAGLVACPLSVT
jgi:hypothetical protein